MRRDRDLQRLIEGAPYDALIVGGGAAGAAVLRSAALAGMRAGLCERADFAAGTSSRSSRLIHGGLRYLEHGHVRLVVEALRERRVLLGAAPHLIEPLPLHLPLYRHARRARWRVRLGLWLYDRLAGDARLGTSGLLPAVAEEPPGTDLRAGLRQVDLEDVARLWDARVRSPERLIIETLIDAEQHGAVAVSRLALTGLDPDGHRPHGWLARLHDTVADRSLHVAARTIVNAAGPWVGRVDELIGARRPTPVQWSRGSHLLYAPFDGAPEQALLIEARRDGRPVFVLPWGHSIIVGTTEEPHSADPGAAVASDAEIEYLADAFAHVWPAASGQRPFASYAGVRPLPIDDDPGAADRRHRIVQHAPRGLFSIVGGKLTTHRLVGEECVRLLARYLGRPPHEGDLTATRLLPGARRDGAAAIDSGGRGALVGGAGLLAGEVIRALREEGAVTLDDVLLRRTDAALRPGFNRQGLLEAARVWADHRPDRPEGTVSAESEATRVEALLGRLHGRRLTGSSADRR